jgi:RimJ/RimL family protein N-acetyltransferase
MADIETARLVFHRPQATDFAESAAMWADPITTAYIGGKPSTAEESWSRLLRQAGHWALCGYGYWVVRQPGTGKFVGEIGLKQFRRNLDPAWETLPEIGWVLAPWAHGQGLAVEAAQAALRWGDARFAWPRTLCLIEPENRASLRVAARCGYTACGQRVYNGKDVAIFGRSAHPIDPGLAGKTR